MQYQCLSEVGRVLSLNTKKKAISTFVIDSRAARPAAVFFALKGNKVDGHDFLQEVAVKGAVAAIVDESYRGSDYGMVLLHVPNVIFSLQQLAKELQKRRKQEIIGITGSVGKTTTKEFIATLLGQKYTVTKTPGSFNSQVGMPLALLNDIGTAKFFVVEMGMQKPGEIKQLVEIAPPKIAVIINIGRQHQTFFPLTGIDGIARAKSEILTHKTTEHGVIHAPAMSYESISKEGLFPKTTFARGPLRADFVWNDFLLGDWSIEWKGRSIPKMELPFTESHFYDDFLAAVAVVKILGLSWEEIALGALQLKLPDRRFQKIEKNGVIFINDCWNADPMSMQAALKNIPSVAAGGKVVGVLSHMGELGSYSEQGHAEVATSALSIIDCLFCIGEKSQQMVNVFIQAGRFAKMFSDRGALKEAVFQIVKPGDVVLIKGSNAFRLWEIIEE
jgi:UDP-N-acetylmuramoyl-tripeptide--D-alanyl-D-alanine ligase